jgi:predicted MFS family arabinose efflux permease
MGPITDVLMAAIIFSSIYAVLKLFVRRKERLIMIEKGTNMPEIKDERFTFSSLKFGVFFIGIGLGVLVANILCVTTRIESEVAYFSMIFLFGGIALVIAHFMEKKGMEKQ